MEQFGEAAPRSEPFAPVLSKIRRRSDI